MSILYIVNPTKHIQEICYRLPETTGPVRRKIAVGEQIALKDLSVPDIEAIIQQNVKYGWMDAASVDRLKPFANIVYSTDKQVAVNKIMATMEHNLEVLTDRGQQNRKLAAVATNNAIETAFRSNNIAELQNMEMTIEEEATKNRDAEISEHFTVDRHAEAPETRSTRPQRNKKNRN